MSVLALEQCNFVNLEALGEVVLPLFPVMFCIFFSGKGMSSVGLWWTTIPIMISLSSCHHPALRAIPCSLRLFLRITYSVLVVPTPATCTSLVASTARKAFQI